MQVFQFVVHGIDTSPTGSNVAQAVSVGGGRLQAGDKLTSMITVVAGPGVSQWLDLIQAFGNYISSIGTPDNTFIIQASGNNFLGTTFLATVQRG